MRRGSRAHSPGFHFLPFACVMAPTRSSSLRIGECPSVVVESKRADDVPSAVAGSERADDVPSAVAGSEQAGDAPSATVGSERAGDAPPLSTTVEPQDALEAPPPLGKGKRKIYLTRYPKESDYLKSAVRHAVKVGFSKISPSYESTFAERYRPPPGVRIWSPDVLIRYTASIPDMVCFFDVAFDNDLRFPLHPFIKEVLQHFNICPSQLAPNGWGILVGLLAFFRDRGLGCP